MTKPLILLGGGGHAAVLAEICSMLKIPILGFTDVLAPGAKNRSSSLNAISNNLSSGLSNYLGNDDTVFASHRPEDIQLINGLGSTGVTKHRGDLFDLFLAKNYHFIDVFHPTAYLSPSISHQQGLQVLAGAIINTEATLGANVLINSRAIVEHHCKIGDHSHIASGAVICGGCEIGQSVHVGAGAVVNQGLTIGDGAIIASGAVVIADVPAGSVMAGIPAIRKSRN